MVRIIYGVSGEGSGHSSRAREIASHLREQGHDLWLVSYDRGYRNLKDEFRVFETEGLCIASEDNRVSVVKTFTENLKRLPEGHRKLHELRHLFKEFQPDCVVTDFEPMTAYLAQHYDIPLISLDNQHRMRYIDYESPAHLEFESQVTKNIIRAMVPRPDVSLITTFCVGPTRHERVFLFPPIVRREVMSLRPTSGDRILVYVTQTFDTLLDTLRGFGRERFSVYGYDRDDQDGVLTYRPFSQDGFLRDLAEAKAVIATAGFTLISEALSLRKPYMALPMRGQFEQELNAFQLTKLGFGKGLVEVDSDAIGDFLYRLPDYTERLGEYHPSDNRAIKSMLDDLLANQCALARRYHESAALLVEFRLADDFHVSDSIMLKHQLIHPRINEVFGRAGHHGRVLIADGNYPASSTLGPRAELVSLNLSPGVVSCAQVLAALVTAIPIEAAHTMDYERTGPYALREDPPVWADYREIFRGAGLAVELQPIEKWDFYKVVNTPDHVLTIQTADQQRFANLLLSIGVRM